MLSVLVQVRKTGALMHAVESKTRVGVTWVLCEPLPGSQKLPKWVEVGSIRFVGLLMTKAA